MCEWKPDFDALNKRVNGIETRMTQSVRIYGRTLTAAEVAANYAIDKERFGLP